MLRLATVSFACLLCLIGEVSGFAPSAPAENKETADARKFDFKAVAFGPNETENTKKLNELAGEGWEYVGRLNDTMVAFRRSKAIAADIAAKNELAKLDGTWELTAAEMEGKLAPGDKTRGKKLVIKDGKCMTVDEQGESSDKYTLNIVDIAANPSKVDFLPVEEDLSKPRRIEDLLFSKQMLAIYVVEGDILTIAARRKGAKEGRPTDFNTKAGDDCMKMTLKRNKE
jgi:uncharacterized protein (TIGR03067 family)